MPEIFRLEYPDGRGPYTGSPPHHYEWSKAPFLDILCMEHHQAHPNCPSPVTDGICKTAAADMIYGFASVDSMRNWFDGAERLYLHTWGIMLSKYFARGPILSGQKQVAFYRQSATLIWQKPLHFSRQNDGQYRRE